MGKDVGVFYSKDDNREYTFSLDAVSFKPIDRRTGEEKAIDDIIDQHGGGAEVILEAIKSGKIHGVKWVDK